VFNQKPKIGAKSFQSGALNLKNLPKFTLNLSSKSRKIAKCRQNELKIGENPQVSDFTPDPFP
jgi:hypothetical protein